MNPWEIPAIVSAVAKAPPLPADTIEQLRPIFAPVAADVLQPAAEAA